MLYQTTIHVTRKLENVAPSMHAGDKKSSGGSELSPPPVSKKEKVKASKRKRNHCVKLAES